MQPNLFIAGAPKCGTTSMHDYLGQHPDIQFPTRKEPNFFGKDLHITDRRSQEEYLSLFEGISNAKYTGESMVYKLYSESAAAEIKEMFPASKIIIMLRNPIDFMHSMYYQNRYEAIEPSLTFEEALENEAHVSANFSDYKKKINMPHRLLYRKMASFSVQVKRYLELFGPENVYIIDFLDFTRNTEKVFASTLSFLNLAPFNANFEIINASKRNRSVVLRKAMASPPPLFSKFAKLILSQKTKTSIHRFLKSMNTAPNRKTPMSEKTKEQLLLEFEDEINEIERVTGIRF